jgi:lysophospholipase L1-like esterase
MVLERRLQERLPHGCVHSVLAACGGYSTHQNLVLLRRHPDLLETDVTILFVGVWNDMLPAIASDAAYAADITRLEHHPFWSLRTGRKLWHALHPPATLDSLKERYASRPALDLAGSARVSVDEMRENVRALVALARPRSAVLAVLPSAETRDASVPWAAGYHEALAALYRELGVPCVALDDAITAFAARGAGAPRAITAYMADRVHPNAIGHAALAEALEPLVLEHASARVAALVGAASEPIAMVTSVEPATLPPGRPARLRLRGSGFVRSGTPLRVLVNDYPPRASTVVDDATIDVDADAESLCRPGPVSVVLRTPQGLVRGERTPSVGGWSVDVSESRREGRRVARVSVGTESSLSVVAWLSTEVLDEGIETAWGKLRLKGPIRDRAAPEAVGPLGFPDLAIPRIDLIRFRPGPSPLAKEIELPSIGTAADSAPLFAQVLVRWGVDPAAAWLSEVIPVRRE